MLKCPIRKDSPLIKTRLLVSLNPKTSFETTDRKKKNYDTEYVTNTKRLVVGLGDPGS